MDQQAQQQQQAPSHEQARAQRQPDAARRTRRRWLWISLIIASVLVVGAGWGAWWLLVLRWHQTTDDAYVNGNVVQITPQVAGTVVAIGADDTQFVTAGQKLVELDPQDARVQLQGAEAQLARTVREVRALFASTRELEANVRLRRTDVDRARADLARREQLGNSGAVSGEELQHARDTLTAAEAALHAAEQQLSATRVRIEGTSLADHPDVRNAAAAVRTAWLAYSRTVLPAPVAGFVARRTVQLGQRVSPGSPLMSVVPLEQVWVEANFREPQLARMRIGQPVSLSADLYGGSVTYHGRVAGFGAGTGSAFALLPAQNATGNWIKIVQRLPVRIALEPGEVRAHPLQIGLSMKADVDLHDMSGPRLPRVARQAPAYTTDVFRSAGRAADERVQAIIQANASGRAEAQAMPAVAEAARSRPPP